jgi:hypothetical protein
MMYIEHLDTPSIPKEVISELLQTNPDTGRYSYKFDPEFSNVATFKIYNVDLSRLKTTWFKDNGQDKFNWIIQILEKGSYLVPHRDDHRDFTISYIIDPGGDNVSTCFYKKLLDKQYLPIKAVPRDEIELVYSEVLKRDKWYKLSVQEIHSVENLESSRVCLIRQLPEQPVYYGSVRSKDINTCNN